MGSPSLADDEQRRTSFGTVVDAGAYDDARPGYPEAAARWLLGDPPPGARSRVLDLAAGTGKLTRAVAALGHEVVAVDPSEPMLDQLRRSLRGTAFADAVTCAVGTAEAIPLPDASVDAVTVGTAWHWMRPAAAAAEIARVLRPDGVLGLAWNARATDAPWAAELAAIVPTGPAEREAEASGEAWWPRVPAPLAEPERADFTTTQRLASAGDVVALVSTYSAVAVHPDREQLLERVRAVAASAAAADGSVQLPLVCRCFRYRRRADRVSGPPRRAARCR